MLHFLTFLGTHSAPILAGGVFIALLLPTFDGFTKSFFPVIVSALLTLALVRVDVRTLRTQLQKPKQVVFVSLMMYIASPLVMLLIIRTFQFEPEIALALMMFACAPPLASTANIAILIGLDVALCLNITLIGVLLLPFLAPPILAFATGQEIGMDPWLIFSQLLLMVGSAIAASIVLRFFMGASRIKEYGAAMDGITTIFLLMFLIAVMGPGGKAIIQSPGVALYLCALVFLLNFLTNGLFAVVGELLFSGRLKKPGKRAATIGLIAGNRNFALMVPVLPPEIFQEVIVFLAFYQLPIYLTPLLERWIFKEFRPALK